MNEEFIIEKTEKAQPLWDAARYSLYYAHDEACRQYAFLKTHYNPKLPRQQKKELDFAETINYLWAKQREKIKEKIRTARTKKKQSEFELLLKLDNNCYQPKMLELFEMFRLLDIQINQSGILKIENTSWDIPAERAALKGFVK